MYDASALQNHAWPQSSSSDEGFVDGIAVVIFPGAVVWIYQQKTLNLFICINIDLALNNQQQKKLEQQEKHLDYLVNNIYFGLFMSWNCSLCFFCIRNKETLIKKRKVFILKREGERDKF